MSEEEASQKENPFAAVIKHIKKAVTHVDWSALPTEVQQSCKECDEYKAALMEVTAGILQVLVGNPEYTPAPNSAHNIAYPPGTSPFEQFTVSVKGMKGQWYEDSMIKQCAQEAESANKKLVDVQARCRIWLHHIRTFINHTYSEFEVLKKDILNRKDDMDSATAALNKGETPQKAKNVKKTTEKYEKELKKLDNFMKVTLPEAKVKHVEEIQNVLLELLNYHEWMATYCRPITVYRVRKPAQ